jgi:DNA-binding response OmpR family regulator
MNMKKATEIGKPRILIAEDDRAIIRALKESFLAKNYDVHTAMDGETALATARSASFDIMLLDIMLPKISGFDLCSQLRAEEIDFPIIILTSKAEERDIIRGLNLGADDYVTKPFSMEQLHARCAAFIRRHKKSVPDVHQFGEYRLCVQSHTLTNCRGEEIELAPKEYALLSYFLSRSGHALTRETLLNAVWKNRFLVTDRSVDRCINTLRKKIEKDSRRPRYIQSIRDVGYRFVNPTSD